MRPDELGQQIESRAEPLPEERAAEHGDEDRRAEAGEILRDSEERIGEAAQAVAPGDAAEESRSSEDTIPP
ncbi:hypothetical protein WEH80_28915 [Actinomycetes bacterium KLBMP 9759]